MSTKTNCTISHSENPTDTMKENFGHNTCTIQSQFMTYEREILLKLFLEKQLHFPKTRIILVPHLKASISNVHIICELTLQ